MHLGAHVLLPAGLRRAPGGALPARRSTTATSPHDFDGFREEPPDPDLEARVQRALPAGLLQPHRSRSRRTSSTRTGRAPASRAFIVVEIQHANPYYDDCYAVNSANLGPYGDAITYELIPYLEKKYRGLGAGLGAVHVRRLHRRLGGPGGADLLPGRVQRLLGRLPGPHRLPRLHGGGHLQGQERLLRRRARARRVPRPAHAQLAGPRERHAGAAEPPGAGPRHEEPLRPAVGHLGSGLLAGRARRLSEAASGTSAPARSTPRWPRTGGRTTTSATSCAATGPRASAASSQGKIHLYVGDMDNYYLNNAVYLVEEFLKSTRDPPLRRRGGLRRPGRALLERRPHAAQRALPAALPPDVRAARSWSGS